MDDYKAIQNMCDEISKKLRECYNRGYKKGEKEKSVSSTEKLRAEAYEQGLDDAWNTAREIMRIWSYDALCNTNKFDSFLELDADPGEDVFSKLFRKYTPQKAIVKVKEYKCRKCYFWYNSKCSINGGCQKFALYVDREKGADDEIRVGDEVYIIDRNHAFVVTHITEAGNIVGISEAGKYVDATKPELLHKTGRHFNEIEEVLKRMQEDRE